MKTKTWVKGPGTGCGGKVLGGGDLQGEGDGAGPCVPTGAPVGGGGGGGALFSFTHPSGARNVDAETKPSLVCGPSDIGTKPAGGLFSFTKPVGAPNVANAPEGLFSFTKPKPAGAPNIANAAEGLFSFTKPAGAPNINAFVQVLKLN
jgi:hypothetical protein